MSNLIHVAPSDSGTWKVSLNGYQESFDPLPNKREAMNLAREVGSACRPAVVRVLGQDGTVEQEIAFRTRSV